MHIPVLYQEALTALQIQPAGRYLDATFGRGGHSRGILQQLGPQGQLLALDQDPQAEAEAQSWQDPRFRFTATPFSAMQQAAAANGIADHTLNGILLDIGLSSPQLDEAERGFSFQRNGPLDMRMNTRTGATAAEWLHSAEVEAMARVFRELGEERYAYRIAQAIAQTRSHTPLHTTTQLAQLIAQTIPTRERDKHPATRTFQAIRIHLNDELGELARALTASLQLLAPGGRLAVITFHSLEDRMVKRFMRDQALGQRLPKGLPVTGERHAARLRLIGKAQRPDRAELAANPRARSALLRTAEALP